MGTAIKHPVPDRVKPSFVIFDTRRPERQSARMSKITNDGLTRSDIGCFIPTRCEYLHRVPDNKGPL